MNYLRKVEPYFYKTIAKRLKVNDRIKIRHI